MSVNPHTLKVGDNVVFCGQVTKKVATTSSNFFNDIWFEGGMRLKCDDPLWELARLKTPELPIYLDLAKLGVDGRYAVDNRFSYTPKAFLELLKRDTAKLEAAGVKEEA